MPKKARKERDWDAEVTVRFSWVAQEFSDSQITSFANYLERHPKKPEYYLTARGTSWVEVDFEEEDIDVLRVEIRNVRTQIKDAYQRVTSSKEFETMWGKESCRRAGGETDERA